MRFTIVTANSSYLLERHRGRLNRHTVWWLEAVLSQGGEFAFVLLATDAIQGVIGEPWQNLLAFAVTLSIVARRLGKVETQPRRRTTMRFMAIVKATKDSEAGKMPSEELLSAMAKFNEEMVKAGVMLDGNGLRPSSKGARVRFSGTKRTVIDGPFAETRELIAGYWILEVKSKAEAIEWIKRCPNPHEEESEIEIRQIFDLEDFGDSEAVAHHRRLGEQIGKK